MFFYKPTYNLGGTTLCWYCCKRVGVNIAIPCNSHPPVLPAITLHSFHACSDNGWKWRWWHSWDLPGNFQGLEVTCTDDVCWLQICICPNAFGRLGHRQSMEILYFSDDFPIETSTYRGFPSVVPLIINTVHKPWLRSNGWSSHSRTCHEQG